MEEDVEVEDSVDQKEASVTVQTSEEAEAAQTETEPEVEVEGAVGGVSASDDRAEPPFLKQSFDHLSDKVSLSV